MSDGTATTKENEAWFFVVVCETGLVLSGPSAIFAKIFCWARPGLFVGEVLAADFGKPASKIVLCSRGLFLITQ